MINRPFEGESDNFYALKRIVPSQWLAPGHCPRFLSWIEVDVFGAPPFMLLEWLAHKRRYVNCAIMRVLIVPCFLKEKEWNHVQSI